MFETEFEEYRWIQTPYGNFWTGWTDWGILWKYDGEPWVVTDIKTKAIVI